MCWARSTLGDDLAIHHADGTSFPLVTLSIGLATREVGAAITAEQLLKAADQALYGAKAGGRNRVCPAPISPAH